MSGEFDPSAVGTKPAEAEGQPTSTRVAPPLPRDDKDKKSSPPKPEAIKPDPKRSQDRKFSFNRDREKKAKKEVPYPRGGFKKELEGFYATIGMAILPFDPVCGHAVLESAPECARTVDELAQKSPAVRRVIQSMMTTSAVGAVVMAHAPILMAVASHHTKILKFPTPLTAEDVKASQTTQNVFDMFQGMNGKPNDAS